MKRFYSWVVSIMNPMDLFDLYIFFSIPQFRIMDRSKYHNFCYPSCILPSFRVGIETY